jgi:hypothetical protein
MAREYTSYGYREGKTRSHWGRTLHADEPTTGVYNSNDIEYLNEELDSGIDLAWAEHVENCEGQCRKCRCNHSGGYYDRKSGSAPCDCHYPLYGDRLNNAKSADHKYDPTDDHDHCGPQEMGDTLIGSWKKVKGQYEPDKSGEYSAIYRSNSYTVQVVWSRFTVRAPLASPCYPGQCSVSPGREEDPRYPHEQLAYAMPPDIMGGNDE